MRRGAKSESQASSSRESTPASSTPHTPMPRFTNYKSFLGDPIVRGIILIYGLLCFIIIIYTFGVPFYCVKEQGKPCNQWFCKKCPKNATCTRKNFTCPVGFLKHRKHCLKTNHTIETIEDIQKLLFDTKKIKSTFDFNDIYHLPNGTSYSKDDLKAAMKFNDKYVFNSNGRVTRFYPMAGIAVAFIFLLISVGLLLYPFF